MRYAELRQEIESLIRGGKSDQARALLSSVTAKRIPREEQAAIAGLARRAALPELAIRVLYPVVRGESSELRAASDMERAEYAAALSDLGGQAEAIEILKGLDSRTAPQALLFHAFALFTQWNYRDAIPMLERYVSMEEEPYSTLVGWINLAAALIHESRGEQARSFLLKATVKARKMGALRLLGNGLQLSALLAIMEGKDAEAKACLEEASHLLPDPRSVDRLRVSKWQAVLGKEPRQLRRIRRIASALHDWESVRDSDFHLALVQRDLGLMLRLYFGTPYTVYRERIVAEVGNELKVPSEYIWQLRPGGTRVFDLEAGRIGGEPGGTLEAYPLLLRLVKALCRDFYRPMRVATLFSLLFPEEHFHPARSPHRVHEAVRRLRASFSEARLPLQINCVGGAYRLEASEAIGIRVGVALEEAFRNQNPLELLASSFGARPFSCAEAASALRLSTRSALRILREGSLNADILRLGQGSSTRYLLKQDSKVA